MPWAIATRTDIRPPAKLVFAYLLHAMQGKDVCWPGIRTIAEGTEKVFGLGLRRDVVVKAIADLARAGLLIVEAGRPGHVQGNRYRIPETVRETVTVRKGASDPETVPVLRATVPETVTEPSRKPGHNKNYRTKKEKKNTKARTADPKADTWKFAKGLLPADSPLENHMFEVAWKEWAKHRQQIHKKLTECTVKRQIKKCLEWGLDRAVLAIWNSIERGWTGLFEPREESKRGSEAGRVRDKSSDYRDLKVIRSS